MFFCLFDNKLSDNGAVHLVVMIGVRHGECIMQFVYVTWSVCDMVGVSCGSCVTWLIGKVVDVSVCDYVGISHDCHGAMLSISFLLRFVLFM